MDTETLLQGILVELAKLNASVNTIARALASQAPADADGPNFQRTITEYPAFEWASIDAVIVARDRHGATAVQWHGLEWMRRRHADYDNALWFSRFVGRDDAEKKLYARLITFTERKTVAKPLPEEVTDLLPTPPPATAKPTAPATAKPTAPNELDAYFPRPVA